MDSSSEIVGASIIEAGASGDLYQLKAIRNKFADEWEFRKICDQYSDFSTGWSVLHHAVGIGHFDVCKFLIKTVGVHINAVTYKRDTPLAKAVKGEHVKIVEFLIKHGAEISTPNIEGFTPLHYAAQNGNRELVDFLVKEGALVEADSADGSPLQIAVSHGNVETVKALLSHGAKTNFCCAVVDTPLICAVKSGSFECMRLLLEAGANPNDYYAGLSTLASAVKEGNTEFLNYLLKAKADPNSSNKDIFKPIEIAAMVQNRAAVEILFPVTEQLPHYPNWTVDGLMEGVHIEGFKSMVDKRITRRLTALDLGGLRDAGNKDFFRAIYQYRMASCIDPCNATWASNRSLWEARVGRCMHSLIDAQKCIRLKPDLPVPTPHHGGDNAAAANEIFKKFLYACLAFWLDPYNEAMCDAFRLSLFDFFAWLIQMSSPDEILRFR